MAKVKNMRRYGVLAILLVVALVASMFALMPVAQAAPDPEVRVQMVVCVDGSGSISSSNFALMRTGLANAVENNLPRDGSVELGVNIFGWSAPRHAEVVVDMTVITDATITGVLADINAMTQPTGWTPTGAAITLATSMMTGSVNWDVADRHIINISTNGHPEPEDPEVGNAIAARNAAITAGVTEIDAECVGVAAVWQDWTKDNIVYPQPGVYAPPYPDPSGSQGFVVVVDTFAEYADAIAEKFIAVIPPELTLEPLTDTNCVCETHTLTATLTEDATPVPGVEITFTVTSGPHATTTGTGTTNAAGQATWSYHGEFVGTDTIVATGAGLTSNEVEKIWEPCPELTLVPVTDTNCVCETHTLTATLVDGGGNPIPGVEITFTVTSGPHATTTGTGTTNAAGQATWSYHGEFVGTDTIVATGAGVTSNEVEKIWEPCPPPPIPSVTVWGIIAAVVGLGGLGVLMLRRRQAYNANRS